MTKIDKKIINDFVRTINEHNVEKICSFMTDDHQFIDSQGNVTLGKKNMRAGWIGYYQLFPDYKIEITDVIVNGETIAAFGFASGTFEGLSNRKENYWRLPASWKAVIKNNKIQLWQVYADSKIPFDIISKKQ